MKSHILCILAAAAFVLSSCVTTDIAGVWKDDKTVIAPIQKTMVVGLFKEERIRKALENELVNKINSNGGMAFPSYKVFELEKVADRAYLAAKIKEIKADSVLITRAIDRDKIGNYIPGEIYENPPEHYQNLNEFIKQAHNNVLRVEYSSPIERRSQNLKHEIFTAETNVYSTSTEKLLITLASDTEMVRRSEKVIENLAGIIAKSLAEQNIIAK